MLTRLSKFFDEQLAVVKSAEYTYVVILAVIIGSLAGLGAVLLRLMIKYFQSLALGEWEFHIDLVTSLPWYWKLGIPAIGGLLVGPIITYFAKEAKGHGVPEVMEAVMLRNGVIRKRVAVAKSIASAISIGTGGSVGREGPIVQIGSAIGSTIGQWLKAPPHLLRTFVACGAAAGIAAAFNAPIAGALFAMEIILADFAVPKFSPIVIASVIATVISRHFEGDFPAFIVPDYNLVHPSELLFYGVLGLLTGLAGLLFTKVLYKAEDIFDGWKFPTALKPAVGGLMMGAILIYFPHTFGVGYDAMNSAFRGELAFGLLAILVFAKMLATTVTLGSGGSGGIFAPSLFMGAMLGGAFGTFVHQIFPETTAMSGAYALVGMGGMVAGATHAPITAILIIFEMTSNYHIILPLMITCITATLLTTRLKKESIYTLKLLRRGLDILGKREVNVLKSLHVKQVMRDDITMISESTPLVGILEEVIDSKHTCFFVHNSDNKITGVISFHDLRVMIFDHEPLTNLIIAADIANPEFAAVVPTHSLDRAMTLFGRYGLEELPVVDPDNPNRILGSVLKNDIIAVYNKEIFKQDVSEGIASRIYSIDQSTHFDIADGFALTEVTPPALFYGKTMRELDVRRRFNVEIILVKRPEAATEGMKSVKESTLLPDGNYSVQPGDRLLVVGEPTNIERMLVP
jgi:chloride channel protein, CIC family